MSKWPMCAQIKEYGLIMNGWKACPSCGSIDIHFPAISLASSHFLDQSAPNNPGGYYEKGNPPTPNTPLGMPDYPATAKTGFLGPYSSSGFPGFYSWRCLTCGRNFDEPSFSPVDTFVLPDNTPGISSPNLTPVNSGSVKVIF